MLGVISHCYIVDSVTMKILVSSFRCSVINVPTTNIDDIMMEIELSSKLSNFGIERKYECNRIGMACLNILILCRGKHIPLMDTHINALILLAIIVINSTAIQKHSTSQTPLFEISINTISIGVS
jgi:hypothetical protein